LLHAFGPDPSQLTNPRLADWFANLSGSTLSSADYFDAPSDLVTGSGSPFPAAFAEYIVLPDGPFGFIPLPRVGTNDQSALQAFADKWSLTGAGTTTAPNHQLLAIADNDGIPEAGLTLTQVPGEISSWVWRGAIDDNVKNGSNAGGNADLWAAKTSAHELAHEWKPNWPFNHLDHCPAGTPTYDDPALVCLLADLDTTAQVQRTNGVARFHMLQIGPGVWHSEYLEIRKYTDPFVP